MATPFKSTAFINYDVSYQARLTTAAWGTEANYVMDSPDPNSVFQFRPLFGFKYFNFRDRLDQGGQYSQTDPATDPTISTVVSRTINSSATNNLFGPQIGARAEFAYSRFLIGVEPKLMMGLNSWQSNLDTSNVLSSTDPAQKPDYTRNDVQSHGRPQGVHEHRRYPRTFRPTSPTTSCGREM